MQASCRAWKCSKGQNVHDREPIQQPSNIRKWEHDHLCVRQNSWWQTGSQSGVLFGSYEVSKAGVFVIISIKMEIRILDTTSWDHTSSLCTCWMYRKSSKLQHGKRIMAHSNISASAYGRSTRITVFSQEEIILKEMNLFNLYDFQLLQH